MKEKHVIILNGRIIAIVENEQIAAHLGKFLMGDVEVKGISYYDFCHDEIREFLK